MATNRTHVLPPTPREDAPTLLLAAQSAMAMRYDAGDGRLMGDCLWWAAFCARLTDELLDD